MRTERDALATYQLEIERNARGNVRSVCMHHDGQRMTEADLASVGLAVHTMRLAGQAYVALYRSDSGKRVSNLVAV